MAREMEMQQKKESERQRQFMEQARENQQRRTVNLMKAKEHLASEIEQLQKELLQVQQKMTSTLGDQQAHELKMAQLQQDFAKELNIAEQRYGADSEKVQKLKTERDNMMSVARKGHEMSASVSSLSTVVTRLQSQLKLRDKLLLEVDEKLLRMQLKLDEK